MNDERIVDLYWERSEEAIAQTKKKYEKYCRKVSYGILQNHEDADECVNETYLRAWNSIPPARPAKLSTFLGKITRNLSLNLCEKKNTQKRGSGQAEIAWEELESCFSDGFDPHDTVVQSQESEQIVQILNDFLGGLKKEHRMIFVSRYWHLNSIEHIADNFGLSESNVKQILFRTRAKLKSTLQKEGIEI